MTYEEFINNILETRGRFECGEEYHERHHIVPKCMGGSNDEENLIDLYAREHFEAHRLLALENPENSKLIYAWWNMAHANKTNGRDYEITAEEYENAKIAFQQIYSGENNPGYGMQLSEETKKKISDALKGDRHPFYGKHRDEETCKKISESLKGKYTGEKSSFYGKHHTEESKRKLSESHKGRQVGEDNPFYGKHHTEETRKKLSEANRGENHPMYGKHHSDEVKKKISESNKGKQDRENHPQAKKVEQYNLEGDLIKIWSCIKNASCELSIYAQNISDCCRGKRKTAGGYVWKYANETRQNN